jgi:hypothetical protein
MNISVKTVKRALQGLLRHSSESHKNGDSEQLQLTFHNDTIHTIITHKGICPSER